VSIERLSQLGALRLDPADDLWDAAGGVIRIAGILALGAVGEKEIRPLTPDR
jgi:hypothetical protein